MTQQQPSTTTPAPDLPPPQTFDILPTIHELLARIDHATPTNNSNNASNATTTTTPTTPSDPLGALYTDLTPLEPKDLPNEVLVVKAKIRAALKQLEKLPDMGRGVEEQVEEIAELEARIRRQREMVGVLGGLAGGVQLGRG
ncbi:hypothetical protein BDY17DRAFT_354654 [Neohortaea acidophila]|uniref:Mediator of RNA polymerase II transcription subunit 9 n=1 Tax=Neohortaea acidophila TaxID=245834 RepID=A0A6A6PQM7_9PEZI|nr:uncharacterized protein BDY17DRAFT_354654 [Neohortaea acidophila]KAF2481991.1 hypothetical protein BDY17DRAFT_354654 [Neohortaea acidophila]